MNASTFLLRANDTDTNIACVNFYRRLSFGSTIRIEIDNDLRGKDD